MAEWSKNPDWIPISSINGGQEITGADGFLASDQNKIVTDLLYLYQHLTSQHVFVGNVTTITGESGTQASVKITPRTLDTDDDNDPELYLDFTFRIPKGDQGPSGVGALTSGMFSLEVEPNGDLYVNYVDSEGGEVPQFEYNSVTGELVYIIP